MSLLYIGSKILGANRMLRTIALVGPLLWCAIPLSSALAEGQGLSANGGSAGTEPAKVGSGQQQPDVKTPYAPAPRNLVGPNGEGKLPVNGAGNPPSQ